MHKLNRVKCLYRIGGVPAVLFRVSDRISGKQKCSDYLREVFRDADSSEYPRLLEALYEYETGKKLQLNPPVSFNDKVQWLKLHDVLPIKTRLSDKYEVKEWIADTIGEQYVIPTIGIWEKFEEIPMDILPNSFALKCTHGSGANIIVADKLLWDMESTAKKIQRWCHINYAYIELEMQYKDIMPRIMVEPFVDIQKEFQFWCINGEISFISAITSPHGENSKRSYDTEWNELPFVTSLPRAEFPTEKPECLGEMIEIVQNLAKGFTLVRVDLFLTTDSKILFNEMTFTPAAGHVMWYPEEYDRIIGETWALSDSNELQG